MAESKFNTIGTLGVISYSDTKRLLVTELEIINPEWKNPIYRIQFSEQWYGGEPPEWRFGKKKSFTFPVRIIGQVCDILNEWAKRDVAEADNTEEEPLPPQKEFEFKKPEFLG